MTDEHPKTPQEAWEQLPPERMPNATYFPAGLAMGTTLIIWSLITSVIIGLIGIALFAAALAGWITDLRHERNQQ